MITARDWVYRAPKTPESHPDQCYYRAERWLHIEPDANQAPSQTQLTVFRFAAEVDIQVSFDLLGIAKQTATLNPQMLRKIRDALSDALQDIEPIEAERDRIASFEAIQEELSQLEEGQEPGCYYCHPDVHYVAPGLAAAKVRELEAAGAKRYMVLTDPTIVDAEFKSADQEAMCTELEAWCKEQGVPHRSADDLAASDDVTDAQRAWLVDYCARWDALMAREAEAQEVPA